MSWDIKPLSAPMPLSDFPASGKNTFGDYKPSQMVDSFMWDHMPWYEDSPFLLVLFVKERKGYDSKAAHIWIPIHTILPAGEQPC